MGALTRRLREAVATSTMPQLQRDSVEPDERDREPDDRKRKTKTKKRAKRQAKPVREALRIHIREAELSRKGSGFEATVIREGPGNNSDSNWYTKQALRHAVSSGLFEGLQGYLNHPTASEERERPERDVRFLAGHFREARYTEHNGRGEVRAKFVPGGMDRDRVISLIESALDAPEGRPLIGISIDGYGHAPETQTINGRVYHMVRELAHLGSADIVTRAGAGGQFHRRLQEACRTTPAVQAGAISGGTMKPARLQERMAAALDKLERAATLDDSQDTEANTLTAEGMGELRSLREAKLSTKQRKGMSKSDFAVPDKAPGSGSYPIEDEAHARDALARSSGKKVAGKVKKAVKAKYPDMKVSGSRKSRESDRGDADMADDNPELDRLREALADEKRKRKDAQQELATIKQGALAAKVLREADLPAEESADLFDDLAACTSEEDMVKLVERKKAVRESLLSQLRESVGIEGAGARMPSTPGAGAGGDLLSLMGINKDELAA